MPSTIRIRRITRNKSLPLFGGGKEGLSSSLLPRKSLVFRRRSFLGGANSKSIKRITNNESQFSGTLSRIDETDGSSLSSSAEDADCCQSIAYLRGCIDHLSDVNNADNNKVGLKKLLDPPLNHASAYKKVISEAIVYGGLKDSVEEDLRSCLRAFLSSDGEGSVFSDDEEDEDDYDNRDDLDEGRISQSNNTLYLLSLQLVALSLEWVLSMDSDDREAIDFRDPFVALIISVIVRNVEIIPEDVEITGLALKCLRLLHSLEPILVKPMLQLSLMPYLIYLREFGQQEKFPAIESEACRLIERGDIKISRYTEI